MRNPNQSIKASIEYVINQLQTVNLFDEGLLDLKEKLKYLFSKVESMLDDDAEGVNSLSRLEDSRLLKIG